MADTTTIRLSATLVEPDGTNTNVYGEPLEPGQIGESMSTGWWNPLKLGRFTLSDDRADAYTVEVSTADLEPELRALIGPMDSFDGDTAYAADPITDIKTGIWVMLAAHIDH